MHDGHLQLIFGLLSIQLTVTSLVTRGAQVTLHLPESCLASIQLLPVSCTSCVS